MRSFAALLLSVFLLVVSSALAAQPAPDTFIDSGPSGSTTSTSASFAFHGSRAVGFQCALDSVSYSACSSPKAYSGLAVGSHTFNVRAVNKQGAVDPTPASRSWSVTSVVEPPPPTGTVIFFDDFLGTGEPDATKWVEREESNSAWGIGSFRDSQVFLDGQGNLVMRAELDATQTDGVKSGSVTTGTDGSLFKFQHGLLEYRAKISCGNGTWDALWASGANPGWTWPNDGEIDVFEHMATSSGGTINEGRLASTIHGPSSDPSATPGTAKSDVHVGTSLTEPYRLCDAYHTYGVDWRTGSIQFLFDGQPLGSAFTAGGYSGWWPFDHAGNAQRLIMGLQLGEWGGALDRSALPQDLKVDWVRVTQ